MKKTLFRQLLSYLLAFGILLSLSSYLVIEFFFDDYYYSRQTFILKESTNTLLQTYENSGMDEFLNQSDDVQSEKGISVHLYNPTSKRLYGSAFQSSGRQSLTDIIKQENAGKVFVSSTGGQGARINWLTYIGEADDGSLVLARISYTNMDSVVGFVQQFFLIFGIALAVIFIVFAFFFSRSMAKPLRELNIIAEGMGKLDFSMRYAGNRMDEIGRLGQTLNTLTANLENTISQLKGELAKEKTLEKMRTGFTAQVSHELQTPLSVIKGYAEALTDRIYEQDETDEVYEIMLSETDKISRLVDDLLDLSQMESGAYVIRKKSFSLRELMTKLYRIHNNLPGEKKFSFIFKDDCPDEAEFFGDPLRLEQAIRNIIKNAMKHVSEKGLIRLSLSYDQNHCLISIFNTGEHIPKDDIPEIFKSYYQGRNKRGGTGLGLAITKHIVHLHGGNISASNTDDGVEFIIELPR